MYYEEQIINGILCWRNSPDGKFLECSKEELTSKITWLKLELNGIKPHVYLDDCESQIGG